MHRHCLACITGYMNAVLHTRKAALTLRGLPYGLATCVGVVAAHAFVSKTHGVDFDTYFSDELHRFNRYVQEGRISRALIASAFATRSIAGQERGSLF